VTDARALDLMAQQIARDGRSLLQYVGEASPYTPPGEETARHELEALAREEQTAIAKLIRFMQRQHVAPPVLGSFASGFTTINFTSLDHLLLPLKKDAELSVTTLERRLAGMPDDEARHLLQDYLDMKRRHLQSLTAIGQTHRVAPTH
jgi:hypothetical protein